jgi:hypothetical protein
MDREMSDEYDDEHQNQEQDFGTDLYKKWFKSGDRSGFLSLRPWLEAGKISVDIGELKGKQLVSHTQVWANVVDLAAYLKAVTEGTAKVLYPANEKQGVQTAEGFTYYGGGSMDGKIVSRILKVNYWQNSDNSYDERSFAWKTGHFAGRESGTGAIIPNMKECLSMNMIKLSRQDMAAANLRLQLTLSGHAARNEDWYQWAKKAK